MHDQTYIHSIYTFTKFSTLLWRTFESILNFVEPYISHSVSLASIMSGARESPNPLRPYHIPQVAIQPPTETPLNSTAPPTSPPKSAQAASNGLGSSARDMFSDLDYSDYISEASPSVLEVVKSLLDQGLWKYTSVLLAQPFDLAKVILQVQDAATLSSEEYRRDGPRRNGSLDRRPYDVILECTKALTSADMYSCLLTTRITTLSRTSHLLRQVPDLLDAIATSIHHRDHHPLLRLGQGGVLGRHKLMIKTKQRHPHPRPPLQLSYLNCGERKEPGAFGKAQTAHSGTAYSFRP